MYESISKNNELENEMTLDMSYFLYSDVYFRLFLKYYMLVSIHLLSSKRGGTGQSTLIDTALTSISRQRRLVNVTLFQELCLASHSVSSV